MSSDRYAIYSTTTRRVHGFVQCDANLLPLLTPPGHTSLAIDYQPPPGAYRVTEELEMVATDPPQP